MEMKNKIYQELHKKVRKSAIMMNYYAKNSN